MILQRGFLMPWCFWGFSPFMSLGITLPLYGMAYQPPCPTISLFTFRSFRFHWARSARSFAYGRDRAAPRNILTLGWPGRSRVLSRRFVFLPPLDYLFGIHPEYARFGAEYADYVYRAPFVDGEAMNIAIGKNLLFILL